MGKGDFFMTKADQLNLIYKIFDFPPRSAMRADRDFVWQLLLVGCPPKYILRAYSELLAKSHPDDSYETDKRENT